MFWHGLTAQRPDRVSKYETCISTSQRPQRESLMQTPPPARSWSTVGADLFHFGGKNFFIVLDYYSNFLEVDNLTDTISSSVILCWKRHFSRHGIPEVLRADNVAPFTSTVFKWFANDWQFEHVTSSPYFSTILQESRKCGQNRQADHAEGSSGGWRSVACTSCLSECTNSRSDHQSSSTNFWLPN